MSESGTRHDRAALAHALDWALGTDANVRILRLLTFEVEGALGAPDAARRTGLTEAGARRALQRLSKSGLVLRVGAGRSQLYEANRMNPLVEPLSRLFEIERAQYDRLIGRLRDTFVNVPEVQRAWIETQPNEPGQPMQLIAVVGPSALTWVRQELRSRLMPIESDLDQTIELELFTPADSVEPSVPAVTWLVGAAPVHGVSVSSHEERGERALRVSEGIAILIEKDPSLVTRATRHLDRLIDEGQGSASADLIEWREILRGYSLERLRGFMIAQNSRADRLRQSSPFFAVLDATERDWLFGHVEAGR